jgi:hypothetical protein
VTVAFVRWRKNCAELLATCYEDGRSRQVVLLNLEHPYVTEYQRRQVRERFPEVRVDWGKVAGALARGPKADKSTSAVRVTWAQVDQVLRDLKDLALSQGRTADAKVLTDAADTITWWRTRADLPDDPSKLLHMTSDDRASG